MASINYAAREISVKIVYYGPGLSGKTTNLQVIHRKVPPEYKSDMVSLATETDRTLFFDFLPLDLGKIKGFATKFQLYTVPGQVYYNATRKLVLRGVDGVVFVADSSPDKVQENLESFQNLEENLAEYGYKKENVPIIIQYNKRDLPNAMSIEELQQLVNKYNLPWSEAVANKGKGVFDSLKMIGKIVIDYLNKKYSRGSSPRPQDPTQSAQSFQQPNQFANNFGSPKGPGNVPPYQKPFQQPQVRNVPQPQQPKPIVPQQQRSFNAAPNILPQQGRMVPPQQMNPTAKPVQSLFNTNNPQQSNQNSGYYNANQPVHPQQSNFARPSQPQQGQPQNFFGNVNANSFTPPPASKPPVTKKQAPSFQAQSQFEQEPFDDSQLFEPQPNMSTGFGVNNPTNQAQNDSFDYSSINLEPMGNSSTLQSNDQSEIILEPNNQGAFIPPESMTADFTQNQYEGDGKTDLDLEIEKYQREIEEKQKKVHQPNQKAPSMPSSPRPSAPFKGTVPNQNSSSNGTFNSNTNKNDYDVYNMEMPSFQTQNQPTQPTAQTQQAAGADESEDIFFTSVDTDNLKRQAKKPVVNPTTSKEQHPRGFLSKFFNRDTP